MIKNLAGIFLIVICLSGCIITAASGTRTEYEDKMKIVENDYRDRKITKDEYIQLKKRASQQGAANQKNEPMSSAQNIP